MFNKFVIVLALLISISMANKLDDEEIEERARQIPRRFRRQEGTLEGRRRRQVVDQQRDIGESAAQNAHP